MKLNPSEFISKAEGLKSWEINTRQKLESIRSERLSIQAKIETLEYRLDSLYMELESLQDDEDEETDNSAAIASVQAEISSTQEEISDYEAQDAELSIEESETEEELRRIGLEEQETLADIQDSASRTNNNIALISSFGGDYANVSAQATNSFQHNLGQLSQAAQILGGSVPMGVGGTGGGIGTSSKNSSVTNASGRNFYEAANAQRNSSSGQKGSLGAKSGVSGLSTNRNGNIVSNSDESNDKKGKQPKTGGLGRKSKSNSQAVADKAAQEYNKKFSPVSRAISKGYTDVKETPNGGISFEDSKYLYITKDGKKGIVRIQATGNRTKDFDLANKALGLEETPDGYTWHHVDDYNVATNTMTLELVDSEAHNAAKPHSGACAQFDAVNGSSYNPSNSATASKKINSVPHTFQDYINPANYDSHGHYTGDYLTPALQSDKAVRDFHSWESKGGIGLPHQDYRVNGEKGKIEIVTAQNIFDIFDVDSPDFWSGKWSNKSDYISMAQHIPLVRKHLASGESLDSIIAKGGTLGACAKNYFQSPVQVMKAGDAYIHCDDGRHRTVAAQIAKVEMPVTVVQEYHGVDE